MMNENKENQANPAQLEAQLERFKDWYLKGLERTQPTEYTGQLDTLGYMVQTIADAAQLIAIHNYIDYYYNIHNSFSWGELETAHDEANRLNWTNLEWSDVLENYIEYQAKTIEL